MSYPVPGHWPQLTLAPSPSYVAILLNGGSQQLCQGDHIAFKNRDEVIGGPDKSTWET